MPGALSTSKVGVDVRNLKKDEKLRMFELEPIRVL